MADPYVPGILSFEYDAAQMQLEFNKLADVLAELTTNLIIIVPLNVEPTRPTEGMVANADGTNWNPGAGGAGLYQYVGGVWTKL